jgi:hypothetical protein
MEDYKSDIADFVNWRAKSVYFFDPAGNIIELIARFDLNNASSEKFSSEQFLSLSEIGLVFPDEQIDEQVRIIMKRMWACLFSEATSHATVSKYWVMMMGYSLLSLIKEIGTPPISLRQYFRWRF